MFGVVWQKFDFCGSKHGLAQVGKERSRGLGQRATLTVSPVIPPLVPRSTTMRTESIVIALLSATVITCVFVGLTSEGHVHAPVSLVGSVAGLFHTPLSASKGKGRPFHLRAAYEGAEAGAWNVEGMSMEGPTTHWNVKLAKWIPPSLIEAASFGHGLSLVHLGRVAPEASGSAPISLWHRFALSHTGSGSTERIPLIDLTLMPLVDDVLAAIPGVLSYENEVLRPAFLPRQISSDPLVANGEAWHLMNNGTQPRAVAGIDLNVAPVWAEGLTGAGVLAVVADVGMECVEDGEYECDPALTYDFLLGSTTVEAGSNNHGHACAGLIAGKTDNGLCGAGVAPGVVIAPYDILKVIPPTDATVTAAFTRNIESIDVHSNSWGPPDTGTDMYSPSEIVQDAIFSAVITGRGGLGSVITWAAGNGRNLLDRAEYDGLQALPYSISCATINIEDESTYYGELGASILVAAPSDDQEGQTIIGGIASIYPGNECTVEFGGTSAATPMVAGVAALMLEANPKLSYLDVADILVETSRQDVGLGDPDFPDRPGDWADTGLEGRQVSHVYGFGLVDAEAAVAAAKARDETFFLQKPWTSEEQEGLGSLPANADADSLEVKFTLPSASEMGFEFITHVGVVVWIETSGRGSIVVRLDSPEGVEDLLKLPNPADSSISGFNYEFISARHWRQNPAGEWLVRFDNVDPTATHSLTSVSLKVYGTGLEQPVLVNWVLVGAIAGGAVVAVILVAFLVTRSRKSSTPAPDAGYNSGPLSKFDTLPGDGGHPGMDDDAMTQATNATRTRSASGGSRNRSRSRTKSRTSGGSGGRRRSRGSRSGGRPKRASSGGGARM